ncbi:LOW QUALITY PROTEIN: ribonuclease pH related [Schistosoma mansoni]|uniref:ribonuclease pH related n=1 Tax=Schistosoma mansoni TaxID=6183 RepID=UPI00022DC226|nr:LOW QUALITY PROTEIN: ribonuclease pH related [Schistosoma mansoni]|eukprot:XP_018651337.1 LOW QUALITY PROTEIN: ribonuclease pH related [Schistosoma mansoni]
MQSGCAKLVDPIDLEYFLPENKVEKAEKCPPDIFFSLETNPITDGSAYIEVGEIKVSCSVNGPTEMRQDSQLVAVLKFASFLSWLPKDVQASIEKKLSRLLLSAIEPSVMLLLYFSFKLSTEMASNYICKFNTIVHSVSESLRNSVLGMHESTA